MPTRDNSVKVSGSSVTTLTTASFTVSASANRVVAYIADRGDGALTSVTACGVSLAEVGTPVNVGARRVHIYTGTGPSSGSQTGTLNGNGSYGDNGNVWMTVVTYIDAGTPADYTTASGTSNAPSVTVPNIVSDDLVVDVTIHLDLGSAGANQTAVQNDATAGHSEQSGAAGGVMSWAANDSLNWVSAGMRIPHAGGGGGGDVVVAWMGA